MQFGALATLLVICCDCVSADIFSSELGHELNNTGSRNVSFSGQTTLAQPYNQSNASHTPSTTVNSSSIGGASAINYTNSTNSTSFSANATASSRRAFSTPVTSFSQATSSGAASASTHRSTSPARTGHQTSESIGTASSNSAATLLAHGRLRWAAAGVVMGGAIFL